MSHIFQFAKKNQKLDWDNLDDLDIDKDVIQAKDVNTLNRYLGNITMSGLTKEDLKILKDKNLIKVFKLGQLTSEYLAMQVSYVDSACEQIDNRYQHQYAKTRKLEDSVKENQKRINMLKASLTTKKQTLKKYEEILYKPRLDEQGLAFICQVKNCTKIFASNEFLVSHYKRKHNSFYMKEIRDAEEE